MSAQGEGFFVPARLRLAELRQPEIERLVAILAFARNAVLAEGWPARLHVFPPGTYQVDGQAHEQYVCALLLPVTGPLDSWRQGVKRAERE
jgi:hypothetical protein